MEKQEKTNGRTSVPQFGGWDSTAATDYSMVFSQARANKKQQKTEIRHSSIGNDGNYFASAHHPDPAVKKKKILTYINCCIKP